MNHACCCRGGCRGGYKLQFDFSKSTRGTRWSGTCAARRKTKWRGRSPGLGPTRSSVRFRGVSARYTSFNRIRMQCCGKFHLSEARGSEQANDEKNGGGGGAQRKSGSRCDFVSTLRTPSRALRSPFRRGICIPTARLCAASQMQSRHTESVTTIESFYDTANRGIYDSV